MIDTNVLFEGLTRLGPAGDVVEAWVDRAFTPCVSTALALEYESVLQRQLGQAKQIAALKALQALLDRCEFIPIYFSYRPASPDVGDDFLVDCVLNGRACLVTQNVRDFVQPSAVLGFELLRPEVFLGLLRRQRGIDR